MVLSHPIGITCHQGVWAFAPEGLPLIRLRGTIHIELEKVSYGHFQTLGHYL